VNARLGTVSELTPLQRQCRPAASAATNGGVMHRIGLITTTLLTTMTPLLAAQEPQCSMPDPTAARACNTAVDAVKAFHPLAGMIVSGGNPVLGSAGSFGGLGHLSITTRVNLSKASLPNPDSATQSSVPSLDLANTRQLLFVNAGLSFAAAKLVAELGYQSGKDQRLTTNFSDFDPKAGHVFGGAGLRFGL
jgi:hypothetical protein